MGDISGDYGDHERSCVYSDDKKSYTFLATSGQSISCQKVASGML